MENKETTDNTTEQDTLVIGGGDDGYQEHRKHTIRSIAIRIYSQAMADNPKDPEYRALAAIDAAKVLVKRLEEEGLL